MGRLLVENDEGFGSPSPALSIALFLSVSALVALCAKHVRRHPQKTNAGRSRSPERNTSKNNNNNGLDDNNNNKEIDEFESEEREEEESGLWQKSIMMGDKCRPPEFSGVIYYDSHGNQLSEMPRSPRATSPFHSFSFPVVETS